MSAAPAKAELLELAAFRDQLAKAVAAVTKNPTQIVDERTFKAKNSDGEEITISIDNAFAQYSANPASLNQLINRFSQMVVASAEKSNDTIDQLVIIVRPSDYIVRSLGPEKSQEKIISGRALAGDLSYFLAVDSSQTIRSAGRTDLERWKIDEASAWVRAVANVKKRLGPLSIIRLGDENGPSGLAADSGLAPSILSDPAFCSSERPEGMKGQLLLVYSRDVMLFALPQDAEQMKRFWAATKSEIAAGRSMSSTPITCRGGRWAAVSLP